MDDTYKDVWRIDLKTLDDLISGAFIEVDPYKKAKEAKNLWELLKTTGDSPEKISNHRAVVIESKIYLYGGLINNDNSKDSLFWLDVMTNTWFNHRTKVELGQG